MSGKSSMAINQTAILSWFSKNLALRTEFHIHQISSTTHNCFGQRGHQGSKEVIYDSSYFWFTPVNRCPTSLQCLISQLTTSSLTSPHDEHKRLAKLQNAFNGSSITRRVILPRPHILPIIARLIPHPLYSTPHFQCPRAAPTNPPTTESCDS